MFFFIGFAFLSAGYLIYRHITWKAAPWPKDSIKPKAVQGHRGYWFDGTPENTLAAFENAVARGLEMIELDVQLSSDKIPVVFHDEDLVRMTGQPQQVRHLSADEIQKLANAPTLEQIITNPNLPLLLNIELKTSAIFDCSLEKKVTDIILKHNVSHRVMVSSFNPFSVFKMSRYLPKVPRALIASEEKEAGNYFYLRFLLLAPFLDLHALHLDYRFVSFKKIEKWFKRGVPVALWTINDSQIASQFLKSGAISIISDTLREADLVDTN